MKTIYVRVVYVNGRAINELMCINTRVADGILILTTDKHLSVYIPLQQIEQWLVSDIKYEE